MLILGSYSNIHQCPQGIITSFSPSGEPLLSSNRGISKQTVDQVADAFPILCKLESDEHTWH